MTDFDYIPLMSFGVVMYNYLKKNHIGGREEGGGALCIGLEG